MFVYLVAAFIGGGLVSLIITNTIDALGAQAYEARMRLAYKECGKLSRIIGGQRIKIKELKAMLPAKPRPAAVHQPTQPVSH